MRKANEAGDVVEEPGHGMTVDGTTVDARKEMEAVPEPEQIQKESGGQAKPPLCDEIEEGRLLARSSVRPPM